MESKGVLLLMSNEEILKKAIEKAVNNGYKFPYRWEMLDKIELLMGMDWVFRIIFSHDFAKAFFGEIKSIKVKPKKIYLSCKYDGCSDEYLSEDEFKENYGLKAFKELQKKDEWEEENGVFQCLCYWDYKYLNSGWKSALEEMVLLTDDEKFKYLEKHL